MTSVANQENSFSASSPARVSSPAIAKAASILQAVAESRDPVSFGDLANRVAIPKSSLHDVCTSLVQSGLLERDYEGRFAIGMKVVELSRRRLASLNIVQAFHSVTDGVDLQETIVLAVPGGTDVIYVSFVQSSRPLAVRYEIGMRLPAAFTATGKAILATRPIEEALLLFEDPIVNPQALVPAKTRESLRAELLATRERGFSVDNEETAAGMVCFGAPLFVEHSQAAAGAIALSLVKGTAEWPVPSQGEYIMQVGREISIRMGGSTEWYDQALPARSVTGIASTR